MKASKPSLAGQPMAPSAFPALWRHGPRPTSRVQWLLCTLLPIQAPNPDPRRFSTKKHTKRVSHFFTTPPNSSAWLSPQVLISTYKALADWRREKKKWPWVSTGKPLPCCSRGMCCSPNTVSATEAECGSGEMSPERMTGPGGPSALLGPHTARAQGQELHRALQQTRPPGENQVGRCDSPHVGPQTLQPATRGLNAASLAEQELTLGTGGKGRGEAGVFEGEEKLQRKKKS